MKLIMTRGLPASGKHHVAIPQFHHWLQQLISTEEAEL